MYKGLTLFYFGSKINHFKAVQSHKEVTLKVEFLIALNLRIVLIKLENT